MQQTTFCLMMPGLQDSCEVTPSVFNDCLVTTIELGNLAFCKLGVRSSRK
jgi:hypothetical protein